MTTERMVELLVLADVIDTYQTSSKEYIYNFDNIIARYNELLKEFLNPYVIDNNSKE